MTRAFIILSGIGLLGVGLLLLLKFSSEPLPLGVGVFLSAAGMVIAGLGVCTPRRRLDSLLDFVLRFWP
jgi:hypothetical protein